MTEMIKGLYETHLFVENINRSIEFYTKVLKLKLCHYESDRKAAFFWIGKDKQSMLGLWEKPKAEIDIRHFAFECDPDWILNESVDFLKSRNIRSRNFLNDGTERPMVFAWMPAIAIYFDDPDGHSLEFIGILEGEGKPENGILTHERWLELETTNP
jgi:lactoylglutathione lyase